MLQGGAVLAPSGQFTEFPLVSRLARRLTWATFLETQVSRLGLNRFPSELACETGGKRKEGRKGRGKEGRKERGEIQLYSPFGGEAVAVLTELN